MNEKPYSAEMFFLAFISSYIVTVIVALLDTRDLYSSCITPIYLSIMPLAMSIIYPEVRLFIFVYVIVFCMIVISQSKMIKKHKTLILFVLFMIWYFVGNICLDKVADY